MVTVDVDGWGLNVGLLYTLPTPTSIPTLSSDRTVEDVPSSVLLNYKTLERIEFLCLIS